jgi:hypothetical protein
MKKAIKILLGIVIVLLVLIVVAAIIAAMSLDRIVKAGVETAGPKLTQTTVTLDAVNLSLLTGSAKVKGFVVGNPEGYKAPQAISVGLAAVSIVPASVMSDKIVVKSIHVESPEITFEGSPLGANNLKKIQDNVNAATGGNAPAAASQPAKSTAPAKPAKKLEVDDFLITGAKVHFGTGPTLPLPDIHLTNLGTGPDGITPADLTKLVLGQIVSGTLTAVAKNATDIGKDATKALTTGAENAGKEGVNAVKKGIGSLFGK